MRTPTGFRAFSRNNYQFVTDLELESTKKEHNALVYYDVQLPEPDVGIFTSGIEITSVCISTDYDTASRVRQRLLGNDPEFIVEVMPELTDDQIEALTELIEWELRAECEDERY